MLLNVGLATINRCCCVVLTDDGWDMDMQRCAKMSILPQATGKQ